MITVKRWIGIFLVFVMLLCMLPAVHIQAVETDTVTCLIDADKSTVSVRFRAGSGIRTDDGKLYLFAVPTYADGIAGQTPVASVSYNGSGSYAFSVALNHNTAASLLYNKFYVAVKTGDNYTPLTDGHYITNPQILADSNAARANTASKKGIHIDFYAPSDMEDLGVQHTYFGLFYQDLLSLTPTECSFTYNGKTYYINNTRISEYDSLVSNMTRAGMSISVGLMNTYRAGYEHMVYPGVSPNGVTENFALYTSTQESLETAAALHYFLASRYNGTDPAHGRVENWIFGNEVNDGLGYYYMGSQEIEPFVQEYLQSFRVVYTAIKSAYSNANVYICLQHRWNTENSTNDYGGRDFIDLFSQYAKAQGDMDWGLAYHAYSFPLNDADILNDGAPTIESSGSTTFGGEVTDNINTPIITMKNLHLLTDYFHRPALLQENGQVRSIILSEQGYTSNSNITGPNEAKQAANIALGYYIAQMNPDIDAFHLRAHTDTNEGSPYFKFGLRNQGVGEYPGTEKFAYRIYKQMDTADSLTYTQFAKTALNITDWSEVVPGWNSSAFATMGTHKQVPLYRVAGATGNQAVTTGMLDQWEPSYNVFSLATVDYDSVYRPEGFAVMNPYAYYLARQGVEKHFGAPLNLSNSDYLTMDVHLDPKDASGDSDRLELQIRLHSGHNVLDAVGIVDVNQKYTVCVDLRSWSGRSAIDTVEVQIREYGQEKSFAGVMGVYNLQGASAVSGLTALETTEKTYIDLSGASLTYQTTFNHTGDAIEPEVTVQLGGSALIRHKDYDVIYHDNKAEGTGKIVVVGIGDYTGYTTGEFTIEGNYPTVYRDVDYARVYAYGYYRDRYPAVVAQIGDDPNALLEHFVTVGMPYGMQGIGSFNVQAYAKFNGDLRDAYGDNWAKYYIFHLEKGWKEGRATSGTQPEDMPAPIYPHNCPYPVVDAAVESTCLTTGLTEGVHCGVCGRVTVPQKVTAALGHTYADFWDTDCDVCGAVRIVNKNRPTVSMYRMYNPNSGEHFYTGSMEERSNLVAAGWEYEGVGFTFPANTGDPVYRLYDRNNTQEHLYTMDVEERDMLVAQGWELEGIAFNSGYTTEVAQYRLHNPNATIGAYHFTASIQERDFLISLGWEDQGIGWYSCWQ